MNFTVQVGPIKLLQLSRFWFHYTTTLKVQCNACIMTMKVIYICCTVTYHCMLTFLRHALFCGSGTVQGFVISLLVELSDH